MKKTRRLLSLVLTLALCLGMAVTAQAASISYEVEGGKIYFNANTGTITGCDLSASRVDIPSEIYGVPVTAIGKGAFRSGLTRAKLEQVTIPNTVTSIGDQAFYDCEFLTSVVIPDSVTSVGKQAFTSCDALTSVVIGRGVTTIPREMFSYCESLTDLTIPGTVKFIDDMAFCNSGLTSVTLPDGVTQLGDMVFHGCEDLVSAYLPDSITEIGAGTFNYCYKLTDVHLPGFLTAIPTRTLSNCGSLEEVSIPRGVTTIHGGAFESNRNLKTVTIPASVTEIGLGAFQFCYALEDVWYGGTLQQWMKLKVGSYNQYLTGANVHFSEPVANLTDVMSNDYYADAVVWAMNHGITAGTSATTFSPSATVTRAQAVTFLWRAAGSPQPTSTVSPFKDVSDPGQYYYLPVLWAAQQGITSGVSADSFGPDLPLAYNQIFTFLCRAAGDSLVGSDWSSAAVNWARNAGLTDGLAFQAGRSCPRSDVIYCLWKQMAN